MVETQNLEPAEASEELVNSVRMIVKTALEKVKVGKVDDLGRINLVLTNQKAQKRFEITVVHARQVEDRIQLIGDLSSGLFISEQSLKENEFKKKPIFQLQTPRVGKHVNKESIYNLRNYQPERIIQLANELKDADIAEII